MRTNTQHRKTAETDISIAVNLDQPGRGSIHSGNGFLDHMLDLLQVHAGITLSVQCKGDTHIDMHHSIEDIAITLGTAIREALGDKKGIERYGFYYVTMDEALARVCLDLCNRYSFVYAVEVPQYMIGGIEKELFSHFFHSFAENSRMNLHIDLLRGMDGHHCIEAIFKAFARALAMAISPSSRSAREGSSKGSF
jgi:imidazoleglycerol-phosphate dehydratase